MSTQAIPRTAPIGSFATATDDVRNGNRRTARRAVEGHIVWSVTVAEESADTGKAAFGAGTPR